MKENIPIAPMTTMKVGGPAKHFADALSTQDIIDALDQAKQLGWPIFILGGGSNVIFNDNGFDGLLIKLSIDDIDARDDGFIIAGSGTPLGKIVAAAGIKGLGGIEWAAGIPGTIGGAVRGNAGAFGGETKDVVTEVAYIDASTKSLVTISNTDCHFGYRDSIFKHNGNIIVSVKIKLNPHQIPEEIQAIAREHMEYRAQRHPLEYPSAGSIFKNVPVSAVPKLHIDKFKDAIKDDPFPIVPVAKIIAEAGLSGETVGGAQISEKHTNYIINIGGATAADIIELIDKVKRVTNQKFGIDLEPEPQIVQ